MRRGPIISFLLQAALTAVLWCAGRPASAQNIPVRDMAVWELNYYNPGVVSSDTGIYVDAYTRYEFNFSPLYNENPLDVAADVSVVRGDHAMFGCLQHDGLSYFDSSCLSAGYMHRFTINGLHHLSVGGRLSLGIGRVDFSKLPYGMSGHRTFVSPDLDLGIEYNFRYFHIGFALKNIISMPGRDGGITYFRYPRAYLGHVLFDIRIGQQVMLNPYILMGMNQNFTLHAGMSARFFNIFRINYSFFAPDFSHNFGIGADICSRVRLGAGYTFSPTLRFSSVTARIGVRIGD